jgi:hypothetical protein
MGLSFGTFSVLDLSSEKLGAISRTAQDGVDYYTTAIMPWLNVWAQGSPDIFSPIPHCVWKCSSISLALHIPVILVALHKHVLSYLWGIRTLTFSSHHRRIASNLLSVYYLGIRWHISQSKAPRFSALPHFSRSQLLTRTYIIIHNACFLPSPFSKHTVTFSRTQTIHQEMAPYVSCSAVNEALAKKGELL